VCIAAHPAWPGGEAGGGHGAPPATEAPQTQAPLRYTSH